MHIQAHAHIVKIDIDTYSRRSNKYTYKHKQLLSSIKQETIQSDVPQIQIWYIGYFSLTLSLWYVTERNMQSVATVAGCF